MRDGCVRSSIGGACREIPAFVAEDIQGPEVARRRSGDRDGRLKLGIRHEGDGGTELEILDCKRRVSTNSRLKAHCAPLFSPGERPAHQLQDTEGIEVDCMTQALFEARRALDELKQERPSKLGTGSVGRSASRAPGGNVVLSIDLGRVVE